MKKMKHILETLWHKSTILKVGYELVGHLYENGRDDEAEELALRLSVHDNSKFLQEEIDRFTEIENFSGMSDPNATMEENIQRAVSLHWSNNRHHPEHFSDYHDMNEIDIMEMACDWYARSVERGNDCLEFITIRQNNRFHFDDEFFSKAYHYCEILKERNAGIKDPTLPEIQ